MKLIYPSQWLALLALTGCVTTPSMSASARDAAAPATTLFGSVPAAVSFPTAIGGLLLIGSGIFCWVALNNRRRALLMICTGFLCAVLPPVMLEMLGRLIWPVVVLTTLAGITGLVLAAKWCYEEWVE